MDSKSPSTSGVKRKRIPKKEDIESQGDTEESDFESDISDSDIEEPDAKSESSISSDDEPIVPWCDKIGPMLDIPFTGTPGILTLPSGIWPIDFFNLLVDESFYKTIVELTNRNAAKLQLTVTKENSMLTKWKDMDVPELRKFIGLILHMGTIQISRLQDYWKRHRLFDMTCFSRHMGRNRFFLILRCLYFSKQDKTDRCYKIQPIIDYFNNKMKEVYYPEKELFLGQMFIPFRLIFQENLSFLERKSKSGMKLHVLSEHTGMSLKMKLDSVSRSGINNYAGETKDLLKDNLNKGHSLFVDNNFSNIRLAEELLENKTYCTGLLNNGHNFGIDLRTEDLIMYYNEGMVLGRFYRGKEITFVSSQYAEVAPSHHKDMTYEKPEALLLYNKYFNTIEKRNQLLSCYSCDKLSIKWYIKLFKQILEMLLLNAYHLYNKCPGKKKMTFYDFRLDVIDNLLFENLQVCEEDNNVTCSADHLPKKLVRSPDGYVKRKRCRYCYKKGIRKNTPYFCPGCQDEPGLCIDPCFKLFHQNVNVFL